MKRVLSVFGWTILSGALMLGAEYLGSLAYPCDWAKAAMRMCIGLMAVWYGCSLAIGLGKRRTEPVNVEAERESAAQQRQALEQDSAPERAALKRMERLVWLCWAAWLALPLLTAMLCSMGYGWGGSGGTVWCTAAGVFLLPSTLAFALCRPSICAPNPEATLEEKDFPQLYAMVRRAAKACGHRRPIRLLLGDEGVGVFRDRRYDGILLPPLLVSFFTKGELEQVLRHEFSHLVSEESRLQTRWAMISIRRDRAQDEELFLSVLFLPVVIAVNAFAARAERYQVLVQRRLEWEADAHDMTPEEARQAVSALAKSAFFVRFGEEDNVSTFRCYEPERPEPIVTSVRGAAFEEMLSRRAELWLEELERELPAPLDSHPTFSQRRKLYGVGAFDPFARETDAAWCAEMEKLRNVEDACFARHPSYPELREHFYTGRRAAMDVCERVADPVRELDMDALIEGAAAYIGLNTPRAMELIRGALRRDPDNLRAKLLLGQWLLDARDDSGLELLYQAAESVSCVAEALQSIGEYVYRRGMQEAIGEYRVRAPKLMQNVEDLETGLERIHIRDLIPRTMPDERLGEIVSRMVELGGNRLEAIGCAGVRGGLDAHVFILKFVDPDDEENNERVLSSVFEYLDARSENYALREDSEMPISKLESAAPGCCVYSRNGAKTE